MLHQTFNKSSFYLNLEMNAHSRVSIALEALGTLFEATVVQLVQ